MGPADTNAAGRSARPLRADRPAQPPGARDVHRSADRPPAGGGGAGDAERGSGQRRRTDDGPLSGDFPIPRQSKLTHEVATALGYDFTRGRQDQAVHPFCTDFSRDDVRITTRFSPDLITPALYATIHEAGHAMYEQGIP